MKAKDISKSFKYINPFYWINKRKNREIYFIILIAKYYYICQIKQNNNIGLCHALVHAFSKIDIYISAFELEYYIPKFDRKFLNAKNYNEGYWWNPTDYRSRLTAFEKLLTYYKEKM